MTNEERDLIAKFISRVAGSQPTAAPGAPPAQPLPPIDRDADTYIAQLFQQYPNARYRITQTAIVQEAALAEAANRIQRLQWELEQAQHAVTQAPQQSPQQKGFFASIFGGGAQQAPRPGAAGPWGGQQGAPQQGYAGPAFQPSSPPPQPQYPPNYQPGMFQGGGSGFLGGALKTAAGVAGGVVAGNMLMNALGGGHGGGLFGGNTGGGLFGGTQTADAGNPFGGGGFLPQIDTGSFGTPTSDPFGGAGTDAVGGASDPFAGGGADKGFDTQTSWGGDSGGNAFDGGGGGGFDGGGGGFDGGGGGGGFDNA